MKSMKIPRSIMCTIVITMALSLLTPLANTNYVDAASKKPKKVKGVEMSSFVNEASGKPNIVLQWNKQKKAKKYQIAYKVKGDKKWKYKKTKKDYMKFKAVKENKRYQMKVRAIGKGNKKGKWSKTKTRKTGLTYVTQAFNCLQKERTKAGLLPFELGGSKLQSYAKTRAQELSSKYSHSRPNGKRLEAGEVIGMSNWRDGADQVSDWMKSSGHKKTITDPRQHYIAVGYFYKNDIGYFVTVFDYEGRYEIEEIEE